MQSTHRKHCRWSCPGRRVSREACRRFHSWYSLYVAAAVVGPAVVVVVGAEQAGVAEGRGRRLGLGAGTAVGLTGRRGWGHWGGRRQEAAGGDPFAG